MVFGRTNLTPRHVFPPDTFIMLVFLVKYDFNDYYNSWEGELLSIHVTLDGLRQKLAELAKGHGMEMDFSEFDIREPGIVKAFDVTIKGGLPKFDEVFNYYVETMGAT